MNSPASAKQAQTGNPRWLSKVGAVLIVLSLSGCGLIRPKPAGNPACVSECPAEFAPLRDDTFGSTTGKLKEVLDQYFLCRTACQGDKK